MRPEDVGIVGSRGDADKQPFMVGFFKSSGIREAKVREKRDARRRKKSDTSSIDYRSNPYTGQRNKVSFNFYSFIIYFTFSLFCIPQICMYIYITFF